MPYTESPPPDAVVTLTPADGSVPGNSQTEVVNDIIGELNATQQLLDSGRGTLAGNAGDLDARLSADEAMITTATTFMGLGDVETPGPTPPLDGNVYVTANGGLALCPRSIFLKTDGTYETWLASVTGASPTGLQPLAIARHSVPQGTQGSAYTSTSFAASGGCQFPCVWLISTAGDALPTGMTFTDNGDNTATLAGTPTVNGTFNVIVHAQDVLGAIDEQTYPLTVAPTGGSFAFALPAFSNYQVGQTVSHDLTHDCTSPAGSLSFTSYSNSPVTGCASDVTANKITKTGLAVANDTVVCIQGLSSTTGISNDTPYYVVGAATGSIGLSLTKGGAAIDLTGANDSALTIQFPTLPNHKLSLSGSTLQTTSAFTAADVGTIVFYITAFDGTTHITARGSITIVAAGGPTIITTSLPAGTQNAAYTTTLLTFTDSDSGATPLNGTTGIWSLDASSDALPSGMQIVTAFGNGAIGGTPTTFGTFHLVLKVTDNNGNTDTQAITLTVAQAASAFAFALPAAGTLAATSGTDFSHDCSADCSNAAGTLSFDSYNPTPITSVAMNNSGDTLTWSGQAASIPNGTAVALEGVTGTPGVGNGPTNAYFVVSSGTRSIQLAATRGGSAIVLTADLTGLTIQFPTLPAQHFSLDPTTGIISALGAQIAPGSSVAFWVRAYDGTTRISKASSITVGQSEGTTIDIATLGLTTGDLSGLTRQQQITAANNNRTKILAAAEQMRTHAGGQGSLSSSYARGTVINLYNPAAGGTLITSGSSSSQPGLNKWHLNGAELRALDLQPLHAEGGSGRGFHLLHATAPELDFTWNGNGANQYQVDFTRATGAKMGYSAHGVTLWNCGPIKFGHFTNGVVDQPFISKNNRDVTGGTANGVDVVGHGHFAANECFDIESHRNVGGNIGWIQIFTDDGSYYDTRYSVTPSYVTDSTGHLITACSGFKSHFQTGDASGYHMDNLLIQIGQKGVPGSGRRHGIGGYDSGRVTALAGSYAAYCLHGANIEGGDPPKGCDITEIFNLGDGSSYTSFETQNCAVGILINGNPSTCKTVNINGWTSTNDGKAIWEQGTPSSDGVYLSMVRVSGANTVTDFPANCAAKTHLSDCKTHACTHINAGTAAADGTWGTYG